MTENTEISEFFRGVNIVLGSLALSFCFEYFVFGKMLGIGFPLFILLLLVGGFIASKKRQFQTELLWAVLPLLFYSWMVFVRASVLLTCLNVLASALLLLLLVDLQTGKKFRSYILCRYADVIALPLRFIPSLETTLSDISSLRGVYRHSEVVSKIMKGIMISIPVLIIFAFLFSSADLLFAKYISSILYFNIQESTITLLFRVIFWTCFFVGGLSYLVIPKPTTTTVETLEYKKQFSLGIIESSIFLGAINILFLSFILIQIVYLFGGQDTITAQGFTYAEYARKGFFELIFVAIFSFLILWKTEEALARSESRHHSSPFKILGTILVVQILIIMVSAFMRLSLYESAYGFTTLRLYSHAFIFFLSVIFLILLYKILLDIRENAFALRIFIAVSGSLVAMNLLNPDKFIAQKNLQYFSNTPDKIDVLYLSNLSVDAFPEFISSVQTKYPDAVVHSTNIIVNAVPKFSYYFDKLDYSSPWQSTNISRVHARNLLRTMLPSGE